MECDLTIDEILALDPKPVKWGRKPKKMVNEECPKCFGLGKIAIYSHVKQGKCFQCKGKGYILTYEI